MDGGQGVTLLSLRCDVLPDGTQATVADVLSHFDPDIVAVCREGRDMRVVSRVRRAFDGPVLTPTGGDPVRTVEVGDVTLSAVADATRLAASSDGSEGETPADATYVLCDGIRPDTDAVRLDVGLDGRDDLAGYQERTDRETTFLTGAMEASYEYVWTATRGGARVRLPVHGAGPLRRSGSPELPSLTLDPDGNVVVTSTPADRFGLRALTGVGATTAERLTSAGYEDRAAVAEADAADLATVRGIGETTAESIHRSARALAEGTVVRVTDEPVPPVSGRPVFVDIETDGLNPSVVWLVGVYDPEADEYADFVDDDPSLDDPGAATREFVSWLAAEYDAPSLVTWNGFEFDFPQLDRFVARHAPAYLDYWNDAVSRHDLYDWTARRENAVLPGRTNRLGDVASALGRGRETAGAAVDGRSLARAVRRLLRSPDRAAGVDWEAARAYCEADVRELAAVHAAVTAADPDGGRDGGGDVTTQTGLADF